jgi:hypothetical protein
MSIWQLCLPELDLRRILKWWRPELSTRQVERIATVIKRYGDVVYNLPTRAIYCAPSVLGFVVVGLMIRDYGICST